MFGGSRIFIIQSKTSEDIFEALLIFKTWNTDDCNPIFKYLNADSYFNEDVSQYYSVPKDNINVQQCVLSYLLCYPKISPRKEKRGEADEGWGNQAYFACPTITSVLDIVKEGGVGTGDQVTEVHFAVVGN